MPPVELNAQNFPTNEHLFEDFRRIAKPKEQRLFDYIYADTILVRAEVYVSTAVQTLGERLPRP